MELSVIIPAYHAEREIEATVRSVFSYLSEHNITHEIIVVPDGSKDRTAAIVTSLVAEIPTLTLIEYPHNRGKGYAVRKGMLQATGSYRLFMDADNSTTIDHVAKMLPLFKEGYDVVIASIGLHDSQVSSGSEPLWRRVFGKLGNKFIQLMAVPGISDTQRGFKVLSADAAHAIFSHSHVDRFAFDIELLALARRFGYKIKEVAINWKNDSAHSTVSSATYIQVLLETIRIRWWLMTGKYPHATIKHGSH